MSPGESRSGLLYGLAAYGLWGIFPLYWTLMEPAGAFELLGHRIVWSAVFMVALVALLSRHAQLRQVVGSRRTLRLLVIAAVTISLNWGVFIWGVNNGHVVETSLGYFINPLVTVLVGVVLLHERLRRLQWTAVGLGLVAVVVLTVDYGRPPWIALVLAVSFATYGLMKNKVGVGLGALGSLTSETLLLAPFALAGLVWLELAGQGTFGTEPPGHALLLVSTGLATAGPLLLFAAAARRVPLTTIGLLQFMTPVLQLLCGVLLLGERVPPSRWVGFAMVWLALALLSWDSLRTARRRARTRAAEPALVG